MMHSIPRKLFSICEFYLLLNSTVAVLACVHIHLVASIASTHVVDDFHEALF